jgi:hypothetical protein
MIFAGESTLISWHLIVGTSFAVLKPLTLEFANSIHSAERTRLGSRSVLDAAG